MSTDIPAHPSVDAWVAAIHSSEHDFEPIGTAVVVDVTRVITCAHVVIDEHGAIQEPLWVAFPKAEECPRRRVAAVMIAYSPPIRDLAVLTLQEPVPAGVEAAPLRCPRSADLVSRAWWAFGFPNRDPVGNSAEGRVGTSLSYGWVRLDTNSRYLVEHGFSGGGLWSRDYEAVVGIVGQASGNGDGRAITLHQADLCFPDEQLGVLANWSVEAAGDVALQQWGWVLARDPEGVRHWRPRARGVNIESERGYRFRGRTAALNQVAGWLDRPEPDRRVLVVTGSPGVGKSAVLGRIVTTADADIRASLPADDQAVRASAGSVSCAVHAKAKTALEVAEEIARAASARLPEDIGDLAPAIRDALGERRGQRFNLVIDALDEAASPSQARTVIDRVVLPLVETCHDVGAQVIVGTRRRDDGGDLLGWFGGALVAIDLDNPEYFAQEDLAAYAKACLQLAGAERPGNPYSDDALAAPFARRIAAMSRQNFLVAGLVARTHGLHDQEAADPRQLVFPATVGSALAAYLERLSPVAGVSASRVMTALAFAEAPGLTVKLWQLAAEAIDRTQIGTGDLTRFARSSAANFLIEVAAANTLGRGTAVAYRLFHQALNDALLSARADVMPRTDDERALALTFMRHGRLSRWEDTSDYLLRSLPSHASAAGLVDDLLGDAAYLLHADLRRVMQVADETDSVEGRRRARLLQLTPQAITAGPTDRVALFSVTEAMDDLGTSYRSGDWDAPYRAMWASVGQRTERSILVGHLRAVRAVCPVTVEGRQLLASAGDDRTIRIWDPQTGKQHTTLEGHLRGVKAVCPVTVEGRQLLASAGDDRTIRIWDPQTGKQHTTLEGHLRGVKAVCPVTVEGRQLLASASYDSTVRIWDPRTGKQRTILEGHQDRVRAVCPVTVEGRQLLASAGDDRTIRIWDPQTGKQHTTLEGPPLGIWTMCPMTVDGRRLLVGAGYGSRVQVWDLQTGQEGRTFEGHQGVVWGVCPVTVDGRQLLASASADQTVRIWDPQTGKQHSTLRGHQDEIYGLCAVTVDGQELLASASADRTVRIWDPQAWEQHTTLRGHQDEVYGVCAVTVDGQEQLASASDSGKARIWDSQTGQQLTTLEGHQGVVWGVCAVTVDGQELLASASADRTVRIWDPQTGQKRTTLKGHQDEVFGVCAVTVDGQELLASASADRTVRIWDPQTGQERTTLKGHLRGVRAVCAVTVDGQELLASASADRTVRIWDPQTGQERTILEGHQDWVRAVCPVTVNGHELVASASDDSTVRIWDALRGQQRTILEGHQGWIYGVCPLNLVGRRLLASASNDRTVRIWDLQNGACLLIVPTYHPAIAISRVRESLAVGLSAGILVIRPESVM
jgi:WD40 repeat protein